MEILHQTEALVQEVISTLNPPRAGVRVSKLLGWIRVFTLTHLISPRIDWKLPLQHGSALSPRIHWTHYPQTCCASHARLALHHVGAFDVRVSAMMLGRVLGDPRTAMRYLGSWPTWLDASCRRSRSRISVGLHVDSAMPCCYLVARRDADRGPASLSIAHPCVDTC